ncbi:4Fe-4S dicluster domain-containing protein [Leisingera thetidis]|uniref:4Fe-4S dicluster domain-containing protein n=1 Tax=Leisingera thetidis TaxID=2930199 RepID=UPI0021F6E6A4|nr:4Fe-4S binding protein [Leisingera thetidis]
MALCQAAHERKQTSGRAQILVLYEVEPAGREPLETGQGDVIPVAVCGLEKITHADLLHGLASGFDVIHMQACSSPAAVQHQQQEVELVQVLGGSGRILLFDGAASLMRRLAAGIFPFPSIAPEVLAVGSRRDTARASAAALLPASAGRIGLPEQAPYGAISVDESSCNNCSSCVWVCPSDALSLTENGCELSFVESLCFQCGLCISICPQRALSMAPGMDLSASAVLPQRLAGQAAHAEGTAPPAAAAGPGSEDTAAIAAPLAASAAGASFPPADAGFSFAPGTRHTGRV